MNQILQKTEHGGDIYSYPGVIDFSANINPLGPPPGVIQAAMDSIACIGNYPDPEKRKLTALLARKEKVGKENIIIGSGAAELIYASVTALRPKKAFLVTPVFSEYEKILRQTGCGLIKYELSEEKGFQAGEDLPDRITGETDMVILVNPNNPSGGIMDKELCRRIFRKCMEMDCVLLVDECFMDFADGSEQVYFREFLDESGDISLSADHCGRDRKKGGLIILKAFTKMYAVPGVRLGYAIVPEHLLADRIRGVLQPWNVSVVAEACGIAALNEEGYRERTAAFVKKEKKRLMKALRECGFTVFPSAANYILFKGNPGLKEKLLEKSILIRSCADYEGLDERYYRIAVRTEAENRLFISALNELIAGRKVI